jgi:glucose-6-phosphate isomerase
MVQTIREEHTMNNKVRQWFYMYITTPIARVLDIINIPKQIKVYKKRKKLANDNKWTYITQTTKVLLETDIQEHLNKGEIPNLLAMPYLMDKHTMRAIEMFYEKKQNGDFDELNLMLR